MRKQILRGGRGDKSKLSDFDPREVKMGMKVEREHTKNMRIAAEIVTDHLREDPKYYSKLKKIHKESMETSGMRSFDTLNAMAQVNRWLHESRRPTSGSLERIVGSMRSILDEASTKAAKPKRAAKPMVPMKGKRPMKAMKALRPMKAMKPMKPMLPEKVAEPLRKPDSIEPYYKNRSPKLPKLKTPKQSGTAKKDPVQVSSFKNVKKSDLKLRKMKKRAK